MKVKKNDEIEETREIPCKFTITSVDAKNPTVEIGSNEKTPSGVKYKPAIDTSTAGALSFPANVTHEGVVYALTGIGSAAFSGCSQITETGLAGNETILTLGWECYANCTALKHTGLEDNHSVVGNKIVGLTGESNFYGCTNLESTGLESNHTYTIVDGYAFAYCTKLKSTGLDKNNTVATVSQRAFEGCKGLGGETATANAGDVVLNQPVDSETGEKKELKVGISDYNDDGETFLSTPFLSSLYLLCDRDKLTMADAALSGSSITTVYVNATWAGTTETEFKGPDGETPYSVSGDGGYLLVVMDPLQGAGPAVRRTMTSDAATLTARVGTSFTAQVSGARLGPLGTCRFEMGGAGPSADSSADLSGLDPRGDVLTISVSVPDPAGGSDAGAAIYPAGARGRPYNEAAGSATCQLPAVAYTVAFDADGGTGAMDPQPMSYGTAAPLSPNSFARDHYDFAGWTEDRAGAGRSYADGESVVDLADRQGAVVTLYAQWRTNVSASVEIRARSAAGPGGGGARPLAGCGLALYPAADPSDPIWTGSTDAGGRAVAAGLAPGGYLLASTRAPAGYRPMGAELPFAIDEAGNLVVGGARAATANRIVLDFQPDPDLPATGERTAAGPPLACAGAAVLALSAAYLAARRMGRG